jgi:hypothetical protein
MGIPVRALLRENGTLYAELGLGDPKWSDDQLIDFMLAYPILINRPILETPKGTRPSTGSGARLVRQGRRDRCAATVSVGGQLRGSAVDWGATWSVFFGFSVPA